jgi:gamma-glutamylcyclotransferase (GGCT)/AIG2-like uncharacterized protein YtfP
VNRLLWFSPRPLIRLRRGRMPPASLRGPVWYFAYGSNMNERLFRDRRHMVWREARVGQLDGYRLAFTVAGGMRPGFSAPANIIEAPGEAVYGVLYLLSLAKFARLDNSEGKQYAYVWTKVVDAVGNGHSAVTYRVPHAASEGRPGRAYLNLIREAARQRDLPADYISFLDSVEARE